MEAVITAVAGKCVTSATGRTITTPTRNGGDGILVRFRRCRPMWSARNAASRIHPEPGHADNAKPIS